MPESQESLLKLKVAELKAKCKLLKIPNYSKLPKPDLIAKILAIGAGSSTDYAQSFSPQVHSDKNDAQSQDAQSPSGSKAKGAGKERKSGGTKRKSPDDALPSEDSSSHNQSTQAQPPQVIKRNFKAAPAPPTVPATSSSDVRPASSGTTPPLARSVAQTSASQTIIAASILSARVSPNLAPPSTPGVVSKPKPKAAVVSKPARARPQFKPLTVVCPAQKPTAVLPTPQETPALINTPTDRIAHLGSHFLNIMFIQLHSNRIDPIRKPPYPTPPTYPKDSASYKLAFQGLHPEFYTSHSTEVFQVGLRFWIARLHSFMQLGSAEAWTARAGGVGILGPDMSTWPPVISCRRVSGDIWKIGTLENDKEVTFVVVGCIGEVIGHSREVDPEEEGLVEGCRVRSDWMEYTLNGAKPNVASLIKSKDSYSFPGGISKACRVGRSEIELEIAERAILASCALNSFSGEKLSAITMDAAWLGRPSTTSDIIVGKRGLDLYLPESAQVMSVHRPRDLHPALAIIHRVSGYSEYVLADTGQIVGTEDEGVVFLWQSLLGCNEKGVADDSSLKDFWKSWELRMKAG